MAIDEMPRTGPGPRRHVEPPAHGVDSDRHSGKRADIQGLRAIAVVLVIANHLTGSPRGGFVGVDVFFVISGYLITGLLLRDLGPRAERGSRLRALGRFYWRRLTRLLPAALTVTLGTLVGAHALFATSRFDATEHDAAWASGFLANVHLADIGTNYFAADRPASPLQHYWSLSVEEQFYLLWPVALIVVSVALTLTMRRVRLRTDAGNILIALPVLATAASFVYAIHLADHSATTAYFSTPARAWELGLGAFLATVQRHIRPKLWVASMTSWVGVLAILASAFVLSGSSGLPAPGALLPCLAAALCLVSLPAGKSAVRNRLLTNRTAVWLGDISYSLYLVHFPIIILLATRLPAHSAGLYWTAIPLTLGAAVVLNALVERPFMKLGRRRTSRPVWVRVGVQHQSGHARGLAARNYLDANAIATGVAVLALGIAIVTVAPERSADRTQRFDTVRSAVLADAGDRTGPGPRANALSARLTAALTARAWPQLNPSIDEEAGRQPVPNGLQECGVISRPSDARCTFGPANAAHSMYLVGDSTAMAYAAGYRSMLAHLPGWNLHVGAAYGCAFNSTVLANDDPSVVGGCAAHNAAVRRDIVRTSPDLLLITNTYTNRTSRDGRVLTDPQWDAGLTKEVRGLPTDTGIAIIEPAPLAMDSSQCYQPGSVPIDCVAQVSSEHLARSAGEKQLARERGWTYLDTESWFCDTPSGYCPQFADGVPIRHDNLHVSYAYDAVLAPVMLEALRSAGVLT